MFVVEIFLPLHDNHGSPFPPPLYAAVRTELTNRFGGVTAFMRAPALGLWKDDEGVARRDEIVVFEVLTSALDRVWWQGYRTHLEETFKQEEILIRATASERL
jgi:hypothetical protein